ncbi:MAG: hypothetical protein GAK32_02365 [Pseudomonas fluorescens]|nr:MAG: hypothetical protein GAK32_02365 [Pseudomonas fluorescens]
MYFPIQTPFARRQGCQVSMATGELLLTLTDARLEGHLPFLWTRAYRSRAAAVDFGLGLGWAHPLQLQPGYRSHHASDGVLTALCDAYGNQVFISRDTSGRIQRLGNGAGHALHLRYEQDHIAAVDYQLQHGNAWSTRNTLVSYRYDALWRLIQATYANGEIEHYRYNEQHLMVERRLGTSASLHWEWELHHNTARCIRYRGEPGPLDTRYAWQSDGRVSVQGMDGSHEEYVHDRFERLVQRIDACGGEHFKSYDPQGRLAVEQAPSGEITGAIVKSGV